MTTDKIIEQIAKEHNESPEYIRTTMENLIFQAQQSNDPAVQKRWAQIPRKGTFVTLEEFLPYAAAFMRTKL